MISSPIFDAARIEKNWGLFRLQENGPRLDKIPQHPETVTNVDRRESAVLTYRDAVDRRDSHNDLFDLDPYSSGALVLGYLPREGSAMVAGDLDKCAEAGKLQRRGQSLLQRHEGYAEISPSLTGVRTLAGRPSGGFWNRETKSVGYYGSDRVMITVTELVLPGHEIILPASAFMRTMMNVLERREEERKAEIKVNPDAWFWKLSEEDQITCAAEMVAVLPAGWRRDYHQWLEVGFSLHRGGDHLLIVWDVWSRQVQPKHLYGGTEKKWQSGMRQPADQKPRTMGSLIRDALRFGWSGATKWRKKAMMTILRSKT
ncbi:PriCT-2 domain-containing protein [Aliiruegeria lutimaris]|uniref:Primase C terminal 2 (PriCT-2) n=1 Tax=Aliiruegeria lutimaris TaxID=571298 RepID=A0A1G9ESC7_9RHOB|nr:PriCT-2 domain-containing protein [Aliiruegeria lutimaris]SDK79046.1 Primase C terminal 2 (PriCT-2) [Aliiruegeria lutimaris]